MTAADAAALAAGTDWRAFLALGTPQDVDQRQTATASGDGDDDGRDVPVAGGTAGSTSTRKKRAAVVCTACHARKVKCDLKTRLEQSLNDCSNCSSAAQTCEVRQSRRGKRARSEVSQPAAAAAAAAAAGPSNSNSSNGHSASNGNPSQAHRSIDGPMLAAATLGSATDSSFSTINALSGQSESQTGAAVPADVSRHSMPAHPVYNDAFIARDPPPMPLASADANAHFGLDAGVAYAGAGDTLAPAFSIGDTQTVVHPVNKEKGSADHCTEGPSLSYETGDVDTGYQTIYSVEHARLAEQEELNKNIDSYFKNHVHIISEDLQESFIETYFDYCYSFCPVLDRQTLALEMRESPLLCDAVALVGSHLRPPLVSHESPAIHYQRAKSTFYNDEETDGLTALKALCLFYWWAPRSPSTVHRNSSWWWTSVIIRHAQQANFHREPPIEHRIRQKLNLSLRRRIWWTAFARERLTALCQSKPCIIDPSDCTIVEPQPSDFPEDAVSQKRGRIFLHWTRLCGIMGRIAKRLANPNDSSLIDLQFSLLDWVQSLPQDLQLCIGSERTTVFDRDVHQLYLPYLTTIIVLYLKKPAHGLPDALPPAMVAASCTARILRDVLSRGNARFLMAITCWYTGMAFVPLLQASRMQQLAKDANESLNVLLSTCVELEKMWGSAEVIRAGCERMRRENATLQGSSTDNRPRQSHSSTDLDNFDWPALFPFASRSTNSTIACLLNDKQNGSITRGLPSPSNLVSQAAIQNQFNFFFDQFSEHFSGTGFNFESLAPSDLSFSQSTF